MTEKSLLFRIEKAKLRATEAIRSNKISGKENAALMAEVAIDAALPVLLAPRDDAPAGDTGSVRKRPIWQHPDAPVPSSSMTELQREWHDDIMSDPPAHDVSPGDTQSVEDAWTIAEKGLQRLATETKMAPTVGKRGWTTPDELQMRTDYARTMLREARAAHSAPADDGGSVNWHDLAGRLYGFIQSLDPDLEMPYDCQRFVNTSPLPNACGECMTCRAAKAMDDYEDAHYGVVMRRVAPNPSLDGNRTDVT